MVFNDSVFSVLYFKHGYVSSSKCFYFGYYMQNKD